MAAGGLGRVAADAADPTGSHGRGEVRSLEKTRDDVPPGTVSSEGSPLRPIRCQLVRTERLSARARGTRALIECAVSCLRPLLSPRPRSPVPFVPQEKDTCAAASLAMVLRYWDAAAPHDEIAAALLEPELHGILGSRLEEFARERGLHGHRLRGRPAQLRDYVAKGRPLIVAWKMGRGRFHDVVVVGFDGDGAA